MSEIRGIQKQELYFRQSTVDLGTSVRHIAPDSGVIMKNWDFSIQRDALVGRYGFTTVNVAANGTPDPIAEKVPIAIYRTADEDTGAKYILLHYDNGGGEYKLAYLRTNPAPTPPYFTPINFANGDPASTRSANSLSFVTARDPGDGDVKVFMTNGQDPPFYWDFSTNGITVFRFGTASTYGGTLVFTGTGLDDLTVTDATEGNPGEVWKALVVTEGTPDLLDIYRNDILIAEDVPITAGTMTVGGIDYNFGATTGHTADDFWTYTVATTVANPDFRLRFFAPSPWRGSLIAWGRIGEQTKVQFSDTNAFTKWITFGNSSFIDCPASVANQYVRSINIVDGRAIVGTTDIIGEIVYTGNALLPWRFDELEGAAGHVFPRATTTYYGGSIGGVIGIDKRVPYLRLFNGNQTQSIDPKQTIEKGCERWVDASDLENIRMDVYGSQLLVAFKVQPTDSNVGTDGQRWIADIELNKKNQYGAPYYPFNMWEIKAKDLSVADEGTDFGLLYFIDSSAQNIGGTDYYFLRRMLRNSDVVAGGVGFGDKRGITGVTPSNVTYHFRTGYWDLGTDDFKNFQWFYLSGGWDGTPSVNAQLHIRYRFDNETSFTPVPTIDRELLFDSVQTQRRFPFSGNAQGRLIQFDMQYTDNQSRPILYKISVGFTRRPGIIT